MTVRTFNRRTAASGAVLCCVLLVTAMPARAGGTHTLSVNASVLSKNKCQFINGGPTALAFGSIDPSSQVAAQATAGISFRCVGSEPVATYSVTSDDGLYESGAGQPRMRHAVDTSRYLSYTLDVPKTGSVPRNTTTTLTINGTVPVAAFQNALVGTYADTVILTISP